MHKSLLAAAAACLTVPAVALAAPSQDKVTGGGQYLVPSGGGAGTTIAFTAQGTGDDDRGQFQLVSRPDGVARHGVIRCLVVTGNSATFAGQYRDGGTFEVEVVDNGSPAEGTDFLTLSTDDKPDCQVDGNPASALGRGNITVHESRD